MSNWISINPISGHGSMQITITAETLTSLNERVGQIIASNSTYGISTAVTVTQVPATVTSITFNNVSWVTDVPATGGTADASNCSYAVYANYSNGTTGDVTSDVVVSGSLNVPSNTATTRQSVGVLTLTAVYGDLSATTSVAAYQAAPSITGIGFTSLVWTADVPASGGTATKNNCNYTVYAYFNTSISGDITHLAVVSGSLQVPATTATTRQNVGTLTLTAEYDNFSATSSVTAYQMLYGADEYLTFEIISGGTLYWMKNSDNAVTKKISYSKDNGDTWTDIYSSSTGGISVNSGDILLFKGDNAQYATIAPDRYSSFSTYDAKFNVRGNIMSLIKSTGFETESVLASASTFSFLFNGCTGLVSTEHLVMPAITLTPWCYYNMFGNCTSLTTAPSLPATNLSDYCYASMFENCTSLTTAPELLTTTLSSACYGSMFKGCTSLTTAPALSATTLAQNCYQTMFDGCTSLTSAPELPVIDLAYRCYYGMFSNCTSLTTAPELPATALTNYCYEYMFAGCTGLTSAPSLPATSLAEYCYYGMFNGCTSLTTAPELPSTTLFYACYEGMFDGCTSLTSAPELPATTLVERCYGSMFKGCTSLTTAPELPATTLATNCYKEMFRGCTSLTTAPELPATTLVGACYYNMFKDCISLTTPPSISAITVADMSCKYMFSGCTSLIQAPELLAATLQSQSYYGMFQGCSNLKYIKCLATDKSAENSTRDWVERVSSSGVFIKDPNMNDWVTGVTYGIPSGWTVLDDYEITGITLNNITWETDVPASGGTANSGNCSYSVIARLINSTTGDIATIATVSGSLSVPPTTASTRQSVGTLNLTASYSGFTSSNNVTAYQSAPAITSITFNNLIWTLDVPANGGVAYENNCSYSIIANYANGTTRDVTSQAVVSGSKYIPATTATTRQNVGTLNLTATYSGFSASNSVTVYQEAAAPVLTGISFTNLTWVINIPASGGTADKNNCIYSVISQYNNGDTEDITSQAVVSGSQSVEESQITSAHTAGTLTLTANYSGFSATSSVTIYQDEYIEPPTPTGSTEYLTFNVLTGGTITWKTTSGNYRKTISYSKDNGVTWTSITPTSTSGVNILVNAGDVVLLKGDNSSYGNGSNYCSFKTTDAVFEVYGNVMSLINSTNFSSLVSFTDNYALYGLFYNCKGLISAENLKLQATSLSEACYSNMFFGCTGLTSAPELPATTLASSCYNNMFNGCESLTTAPDLPATTLVGACYYNMFRWCTSLNHIKCLATDISATNCTFEWTYQVPSGGTFVKDSNMSSWTTGTSGIPSGWTVQNA